MIKRKLTIKTKFESGGNSSSHELSYEHPNPQESSTMLERVLASLPRPLITIQKEKEKEKEKEREKENVNENVNGDETVPPHQSHQSHQSDQSVTTKRGRGRPRTRPISNAPTGKRGRPRLNNPEPAQKVFSLVNRPNVVETKVIESYLIKLKIDKTAFQDLIRNLLSHENHQYQKIIPQSIITEQHLLHDQDQIPEALRPTIKFTHDHGGNSTLQRVHPVIQPSDINPELISYDSSSVDYSIQSNQKPIRITVLMSMYQDGWPTHSPYACWHCTETFLERPVGIPDHVDDLGQYHCCGNFCSYNCAAGYLFEIDHSRERWEKYAMMVTLCRIINDLPITYRLTLAPPRSSLKKFGGKLTITEYRQTFVNNKSYKIFHPPLVPITLYLEEINPNQKNPELTHRKMPLDRLQIQTLQKTRRIQHQQDLKDIQTIDKCFLPGKIVGGVH